MAKHQMTRAQALSITQSLVQELRPVCERLLITGSLRRGCPTIGDIELVVIPKMEPVLDMFGDTVDQRALLDECLTRLSLTFSKNGPRWKQFPWREQTVDLFIQVDPATWGMNATIRTGSQTFSEWLVTARQYGGGLPAPLISQDARLWDGTTALDTPEELDVFRVLGLPWVAPQDRTAAMPALYQQGYRVYRVVGTLRHPTGPLPTQQDVLARTPEAAAAALRQQLISVHRWTAAAVTWAADRQVTRRSDVRYYLPRAEVTP
ncbi:MAG: hypothetical protein HC828_05980 [Blastochloris sp.]|nr:hypothetical protein [Blastochloris sp.]